MFSLRLFASRASVSVARLSFPAQRGFAAGITQGTVKWFDATKGFGFITHQRNSERLFFHVNQLQERVKENDKVVFDVEKGPRGLSAVNVKKA